MLLGYDGLWALSEQVCVYVYTVRAIFTFIPVCMCTHTYF